MRFTCAPIPWKSLEKPWKMTSKNMWQLCIIRNCDLGNASITLLEPIHILQNKFVRLATYKDGYPNIPGPLSHTLFHKLRILNIFYIFRLQLGKLVYEAVNGIGPSNKVLKFHRVSDIHCHNTRYMLIKEICTLIVLELLDLA